MPEQLATKQRASKQPAVQVHAVRERMGDWLPLSILAAMLTVAVALMPPDLQWGDEPIHLMDGQFILDFLRYGDWTDPIGWAERYYVQFPTLGLIVYFPPVHPTLLAGWMSLFGETVLAARLLTIFFACATAAIILKHSKNQALGWLATAAVLLAPATVALGMRVMLELPAACFILGSSCCYLRYLHNPKRSVIILAATLALIAVLTKQQAVYLYVVLFLHVLCVQRHLLTAVGFVVPWAISAGLAAGYLAVNMTVSQLPAALLSETGMGHSLFYFQMIPSQWGVLLLIVFAAAITLQHTVASRFWLLHVGAFIVFCSLVGAKEERYLYFSIPIAGMTIATMKLRHATIRRATACVAAGLIGVPWIMTAIRTPAEGTFARAMSVIQESSTRTPTLVLVDVLREGQFTWTLRHNAAARNNIIPLRASKVLFSRAARARWLYEGVDNPGELRQALALLGATFILLDNGTPPGLSVTDWDPPPRQWLREEVLQADRYQTLWTGPSMANLQATLYATTPAQPSTMPGSITLPVAAAGRSVTVAIPFRSVIPPDAP